MSHHDDDVVGKAYDARLMRRLLGYLRPYAGHATLALIALMGAAAWAVLGLIAWATLASAAIA